MARTFNGCKGKALCSQNETECRTCGRSLAEIQATRHIIAELAGFIVDMDYANANDLMFYVTGKALTKAAHLEERKQQVLTNGYH